MYTFCEKETGKIVGTCSANQVNTDDYFYVPGVYDGNKYYYNLLTNKITLIEYPYPEVGFVSLPDLQRYVHTDLLLDMAIANILQNTDPAAIDEFRKNHYAMLRRWVYPKQAEYLDAQAKIRSEDPTVLANGEAQLAAYYRDCLSVKDRFPSP